MVALPCSMPLVNAYLFSVVQSLFLIVMMADVPRQVARQGAMDGIRVRSYNNADYYWGIVVGNFILFLAVNAVVVLFTIFVVNLTSLAEIGWKYYLFYLLTLNVPSWVLAAGLTLGLSSITGSRFPAMMAMMIWLAGCVLWLPYCFHGTFDFLASGVPNLFSGIVGHVNLLGYLLHRSAYFLFGLGGMAWGLRGLKRLPNEVRVRGVYARLGVSFIVVGVGCGLLLESFYFQDRVVRESYRGSFTRNWNEETCRVRSHAIKLEQSGERITASSDMMIYNPGKQCLNRVVLFLNPGLRVTVLSSGKDDLAYRRDEQAILIEYALEAGDSLSLHVEYEGIIDDRYCDLHLSDRAFEDSFRGDTFFPTGRRGAFAREDLLLLTPASTWYPVAIPPVNPLMPLATGRDFTLFRLFVKHPLQKTLFSQGRHYKASGGEGFVCRKSLHGISLYGNNFRRYSFRASENYGLQFGLTEWGGMFARRLSRVSRRAVISLWKETLWLERVQFETIPDKRWYEPSSPWLYLAEVPVSFYLDSHEGKPEAGLVESGLIFFPERGFEMDLTGVMNTRKIKSEGDLLDVCSALHTGLFAYNEKLYESHPLWGFGRWGSRERGNGSRGESLWVKQNVWVHSSKFPFIGETIERFQNDAQGINMAQGVYGEDFSFSLFKESFDYLTGHTLREILQNENVSGDVFRWKLKDLWMRLTLAIPRHELQGYLDSLYDYRSGEIDYDALVGICRCRWGVDVDSIITQWVETRHEQYFKIKDMVRYWDPVRKYHRAEGKVMNAGKTGGVVSIEYGKFPYGMERSSCFLKPGEAKSFTLVDDRGIGGVDMGLCANRPFFFMFPREIVEADGSGWQLGSEWQTISEAEFLAGDNSREIIADDSGSGFELVDGNLTWIQKWLSPEPRYREFQGEGESVRWEPVIDGNACGDSIRGYHRISGGAGKSSATWRVVLPEGGRYRVMGKVYKKHFSAGMVNYGGIVYYYTVSCGGVKKEVEVNLDICLPGNWDVATWASLGEYDFPAGEVSVTLSDREVQGRKDVAIVADAVKFIKLE